ncbi:hypothetical protein KAF25_008785 [Fusarium avenaceum]|uniref:Uncharacterized protein n=1 Tax=Fusarium avenaceum TaxID=40199 RepID=A0A9P7KT67_9HYPO|nr:hypothetical protein KAF25_008785 [Fusarium avenaceum]
MTATDHFQRTTLPQPQRFITTHDEAGRAVYLKGATDNVSFWPVGPKVDPAGFGLGYATSSMPVRLTDNEDLADFAHLYDDRKKSGLVKQNGSVLRYVDYPPLASSPMHRTVSCDFAVVLVGEMECLLDSGESRILKSGDTLVQRGTMHQWINYGKTWARMLYVLLDATPVVVGGKLLGEELGGMEGVPSSL